jgi:hypothetical protein
MPGIFKKIKSILKFVGDHAHFLNYVVPGLGSIISAGAKGADKIADGVNKIHTDYTTAKKEKRKYTFLDGVKSGFEGLTSGKDNHIQFKDVVENIQKMQYVKLNGITSNLSKLNPMIVMKDST